jgi:ATP-dependent Clp protease ATP-binding subunit ClpB
MGSPNGDIAVSQNLLRLLNTTEKLSTDKGDSYLSTELFLLAIISGNDTTTKLLKDLGIDKKSLSTAIDKLRGGGRYRHLDYPPRLNYQWLYQHYL